MIASSLIFLYIAALFLVVVAAATTIKSNATRSNAVPVRYVLSEDDLELYDGRFPYYGTDQSAGFDLAATEQVVIAPGETAIIGTGLFLQLPPDKQLEIRPRSGLAFKQGITVLNAPGTIDADYRNEIKVLLINHGKKIATIYRGDRIAQGVLTSYDRLLPERCDRIEDLSETNRTGGFGSTG